MSTMFDQETKRKAVRLVVNHGGSYSSEWAAITAVAGRFGMAPGTLRKWVKESQRECQTVAGPLDLAAENRALRKKAAELEQTIEIR